MPLQITSKTEDYMERHFTKIALIYLFLVFKGLLLDKDMGTSSTMYST